MFLKQLTIVAVIATISNAAPAPIRHVLHEERHAPPTEWIKGARIESDAILPMRIGLSQTNLEKGHDFLMEV